MNNEPAIKGEPVAWMEKDEFDDFINGHRSKLYGYIVYRYNPMEGVREDYRPDMEGAIPLYTAEQLHPANTLTNDDCECLEGLMGMYWDLAFKEGSQDINLSEQANDVLCSFRAILRKAQE